jgi:anti-sigma B factor antagonist
MSDYPRLGTIEVEEEGDVVVVRLLGEHDLATRPAVIDRLGSAIEAGRNVIVDVTDTEFIDASILSALIAARHLAGPNASLVLLSNPSCAVHRVLAVSGINEILPGAGSRTEAIQLARS